MSSPFTNAKEFLEAKGPIYTFANNPTIIGLLLALNLAIAIYFLYSSFAMYRKTGSKGNDPALMSVLLIAGLATSLAGSLLEFQRKQPTTTAHRQDMRHERRVERHNNPIGMFLGLMGAGSVWTGQRRSQYKRYKQRRF